MAERAMMTAKDLATDYGFSPRHWIRLAAQGRIPGARQPFGKHGHSDSASLGSNPSPPANIFPLKSALNRFGQKRQQRHGTRTTPHITRHNMFTFSSLGLRHA